MIDHRDRLILALSALLRAEREARDAFQAALAAGELAPQTLHAMAGDPISVLSQDDLNFAEEFAKPYLPARRHELS
jgi:hypothetical protein